ncbi:hypothetical protein Tco_0936215 [Tanacetum coccineum]
MDDPDITVEEYIWLETKQALRKAIVYNDALTSELDLSCQPTVRPQRIDKVIWKIQISLSDSDEESYTVIYDNDSFSYKIFNVNDLKLDMGNGDDKIDIKPSSGDISIEPLANVINTNVGAYTQGSNKLLETSHDTSSLNTATLLNKNDDFGGVFIFWNSVCCHHAGLTAIEAFESIQEMEDHSHKWRNEESDRKTSNGNSNSLNAITNKLKNLNRDMNNLWKNVHKIHQRSTKSSAMKR